MAKSIFDSFIRKYALSKTLRFELIPTEKTRQLLKENNVFEKDEKIEQAYQEIKPLFDQLHRKFVAEALHHKNIDAKVFQEFAGTYSEITASGKKDFKKLKEAKTKIYRCIAELLNKAGDRWKEEYGRADKKKKGEERKNAFKSDGFKILTDAHILKVLKKMHPDKEELIGSFEGFFTYFSGFNENRENFYKGDGTSTAIATRITDNFVLFLQNIDDFKKYYATKQKELELQDSEIQNFKIEAYPQAILQKDIEHYNSVVGTLNKRMKEVRDRHAKDDNFKKSNYPLLLTLQNQILGEHEKKLLFEQIKDEVDAQERLAKVVNESYEHFNLLRYLFKKLADDSLAIEDESGIYFSNRAINTLSRRFLNDAFSFEQALPQRVGKKDPEGTKVAYFVSLADVREALEKQEAEFVFKDESSESTITKEDRLFHLLSLISHEFQQLFTDRSRGDEVVIGFNEAHAQINKLLSGKNKDVRDQENRKIIKTFFDAGMPIFQIGKYFSLAINNKRGAEKPTKINAEFYNAYDEYTKEDFNFAKQFDLFRNYISKKPGDDEGKVKLNFEKPNLLKGFSIQKEGKVPYCGYILRKLGTYYLGIAEDDYFLSVEKYPEELEPKDGDDTYEMLEPYQLNWGKNIAGGRVYESYTKEKLGESVTYQTHKATLGKKEHVDFVKALIHDRYLDRRPFLKEYLEREFENIDEMREAFDDQDVAGMEFVPVKADRIDKQQFTQKKKTKNLYLFTISNKDLRQGRRKPKNIHSQYWLAMFSDENMKRLAIKLSGGAEVFLRRSKAQELKERKVKKRTKWQHTVLEHRRYADDKTFLHIPIVLNYGEYSISSKQLPWYIKQFNEETRKFLAEHPETCIIGIDRGEKHLLYYSVINQKKEILEQGSMNELEVAGKKVNFHKKLTELEKERIRNRQSWELVRAIKDLKKGYVSHAIHKITQLIDKHKAIVVLEDLNMRFKQVRGGVERSVYQQFEKALIDKLGYLVFKNREPDVSGGVRHGYQLAAPFESFERLGKQTGIIFYTQADYTSITDPISGFRKNVYISNSESVNKLSNEIFGVDNPKIRIGWDEERKSYTFTYNQADFVKDKKSAIQPKEWTLYADVHRIKRSKENGYWQYIRVNPNEMLENLFKKWDIQNPHKGTWDKIVESENLLGHKEFDGKKRNFWQALIFIFNLILQIRNSSSVRYIRDDKGELVSDGEDVDFIASPVEPFFRTLFTWEGIKFEGNLDALKDRIVGEGVQDILASYNGDANGAYNIARKGNMILERIRANPEIEEKDLFIRKEEWDKYSQKSL